ncbi:MAG: hypothetical protein AAFP69_21575, partial [Planctomycetota bacterium]
PIGQYVDTLRCDAILFTPQHSLGDITRGQSIRIRLDALPHTTFTGTTTSISQANLQDLPAELTQPKGGREPMTQANQSAYGVTQRTLRVEIQLPFDERILPGMRGRALITSRPASLTTRIYRFIRSTFYFDL